MQRTDAVMHPPLCICQCTGDTLLSAKGTLLGAANALQKTYAGMRSAGCAMPLTEDVKSTLQADFLH